MKKETLIELAEKWEARATSDLIQDGSDAAKITNAIDQGRREAQGACAADLRMLIKLLS